MTTVDSWATADRLVGRGVIVIGDFNKSFSTLGPRASLNALDSLSDELQIPKPDGIPFSSFNGSWLIGLIFLQTHDNFEIPSIGCTMHPLFSEFTYHNPIWAGIQWPETPTALSRHSCSVRITNHPDLPMEKDVLADYAAALDNAIMDI